jgi:hypothetical protein
VISNPAKRLRSKLRSPGGRCNWRFSIAGVHGTSDASRDKLTPNRHQKGRFAKLAGSIGSECAKSRASSTDAATLILLSALVALHTARRRRKGALPCPAARGSGHSVPSGAC